MTRAIIAIRNAPRVTNPHLTPRHNPIEGIHDMHRPFKKAESPSFRFAMDWRMGRQEFYVDNQSYVNEGGTNTHPSHDLAHLLIAANGGLAWKPANEDRTKSVVAEYNAIFLETLLDRAYNCVFGLVVPGHVIPQVKQHARWLVEKHYSPFPIPFEQAFFQLCSHLNPEIITRLSPHYFNQKTVEARDQNSGGGGSFGDYKIAFNSNDTPPAEGLCLLFRRTVRQLVDQLKIEHLYPTVSCTSHFICD